MPLTHALCRVSLVFVAACGLMFCGVAPASAQGLAVSAITVEGKPAQSAAGVQVRLAGAAASRAQTLKLGEAIAPGAELSVPGGVTLVLSSAAGNALTLHPGSRFLTGVVTSRGEAHQPLAGRIDFLVRQALDFFNVRHERIVASVKGTAFRVDIDPASTYTLSVSEGVVEVEWQEQIRIADIPSSAIAGGGSGRQDTGIRVAEDVHAGQSKTRRLDVEEFLAEFRNFNEAETHFRKALAEAEASGDRRRILRALHNLMELYWMLGRPRAALEWERRCVQMAQGLADPSGETVCLTIAGLAHHALGAFRQAIAYHEKALAIRLRLYPEGVHSHLVASLNNLGIAYRALGDNRRAIAFYERALAMEARLFGGRDHMNIAATYHNLGVAHRALGDTRQAIAYYEPSLAMLQRIHPGRDHPLMAVVQNNLGIAYRVLGEPRKAIDLYERALVILQRVHGGRDHPDVGWTLANLGSAYDTLREPAKAIDYYEKALAMRQRLFAGRDHPDVAQNLNNLGVAYSSLGDLRRAIDYYERAVVMAERLYAGRDHRDLALYLSNLANAYGRAGNAVQAARYRERADAMSQRVKQR